MKKVNIRKLLTLDADVMRDGLKKSLVLVYEDGVEVVAPANTVIAIRYILDIFSVLHELPIVSKYHITNYYSNGTYVAKSFNKLFENILVDYTETYTKVNGDKKYLEVVYQHMQAVFNNIFNKLVHGKIEYATSLNIDDFIEIQMDERLLTAIKVVDKDKTLDNINKSYAVLDNVIRDPKYSDNIIARSYIAGTVNPNQVKQMLASRGYVTEIDSSIFKIPISSSFTLGLNNIYELAIESRSGAKALFLSNRAIQEAEYFARELQLVTMFIDKLEFTDCGSTEYVDWLVRDESYTGKSDLPNLIGKYYLNDKTGKEEVITIDDTDLIGRIIKLRSVTTCKLTRKDHVCSKCYGDLSFGIFDNTSLGHICSTTLTQQITQSILSTKHLTSSATSSSIVVDDVAKKFFSVKNKNGLALRTAVLGKARSKMFFVINQNEGFGIKDINSDSNIYKLNLARVSRIDTITIRIEHDGGKIEEMPISVKQSNRYGNFTHIFLKHVMETGYTLNEGDDYVVDMSTFKSTDPIITLPQVEFNFLALAKSIKKEFKSMEVVKGSYSKETPESLLQKVFDLVNFKLNVNIAIIEVIVASFTIMSHRENNYDMGRNSNDPQLAKISDILANRSLGGSLPHEKTKPMLMSPKTSYGRNAVDHPLDVLFMPAETVANAES